MKKNIIIISLFACIFMFSMEQVFSTGYLSIIISKWIMFFLIPIYYLRKQEKPLKEILGLDNIKFDEIKLGLFLGITFFIVIIVSYFLFKTLIDFDLILVDLEAKGINGRFFILVGIYICFGNSILEEFFFRGFIFLNLKKNLKFAYLYSSSIFAIYHVGIILVWFDVYIMLLALAGLTIGGLFFNYLALKSNNFLNSWLVHFFADAAIILIGINLFYF